MRELHIHIDLSHVLIIALSLGVMFSTYMYTTTIDQSRYQTALQLLYNYNNNDMNNWKVLDTRIGTAYITGKNVTFQFGNETNLKQVNLVSLTDLGRGAVDGKLLFLQDRFVVPDQLKPIIKSELREHWVFVDTKGNSVALSLTPIKQASAP